MIRILPNGGTVYTTSPSPTHDREKRGKTQGWSRAVSRRNTDFLMSVDVDSLSGFGFALSLTVRECPGSPAIWAAVRKRFFERLRSAGMVRAHWLTEWQRRQVPHMHCAVWFSRSVDVAWLKRQWIHSAVEFRPASIAQHVVPIEGVVGWFEYLAKHASRSISNYQRSKYLVPASWAGATGRMWGYLGSWVVLDEKCPEVPVRAELHYRRLLLRYQIAKARRQGDRRRVIYLRRYLSAWRGFSDRDFTSERVCLPRFWISEDEQWSLLACALRSHGDPEPSRKGVSDPG